MDMLIKLESNCRLEDSDKMKKCFRCRLLFKYGVFLFAFILFILTLFSRPKRETYNHILSSKRKPQIKKFSNEVLAYDLIKRICYDGVGPKGIKELHVYIDMLNTKKHEVCNTQYSLFQSMYQLRRKTASISMSEIFQSKLNESLHVDRTHILNAQDQNILFVDNLYSLESVTYNNARIDLPDFIGGNLSSYIMESVEKTRPGCDFCSFAKTTATDTFGRMESKSAVIVSNAFKIEKYHGLAILKNHHPLRFSQFEFIDCMHLIMKWFKQVHEISQNDLYRIIYWDLLLKAGISQMHPHMHLTYGSREYYSKWNELYKAGLKYSEDHDGSNYWSKLLQIHTSLGLALRFGNASAMAYLTPKRDYEILVISTKPCIDFFRLVFFTIRAFIDDLNEPSITMGWVFPKLHARAQYGDELPMIFRIVSRGNPMSLQSDISSFDLYGTANINKDPYEMIRILRTSIERREKEKFEYTMWKE